MVDMTKKISGDIVWSEDEDHSPALEFRAEVSSEAGYPLFVKGYLNQAARKLTYAVIHRAIGRIYGLDLGRDHHNPDCERVGEKHKHSWSEQTALHKAYVPEDITAAAEEPCEVWQQFCAEANLYHEGTMLPPPAQQLGLL